MTVASAIAGIAATAVFALLVAADPAAATDAGTTYAVIALLAWAHLATAPITTTTRSQTVSPPAHDSRRSPHSRERLADHGPAGQVKSWWREWGGLVTGGWLIVVSIVLAVVAISFVRDQSATDRAARASCERSRVFGPPLADAYARYAILTPQQIAAYRATIPTRCPR